MTASEKSSDVGTATPAKDGEPRHRPWRGLGLGTLGAIFGLITGVVSFIFLVDPALRPDPRTTQAATLTAAAFDQGITLRAYAQRLGQGSSPEASTADACAPGNVAYLQENLQGFKSRHTVIRFLTYDARTGTRLNGVYGTVSGGEPNIEVTSEVSSDQSVSLQWVQWPFRNGLFFVRFEVFHGDSLLAVTDTPKFTVTQNAYRSLVSRCLSGEKLGRLPEQPSFREGKVGGGGGGTDWTRVLTDIALGSAAALALVGGLSVAVRLRRRGQDARPAGE